jgi:hypothetical protein
MSNNAVVEPVAVAEQVKKPERRQATREDAILLGEYYRQSKNLPSLFSKIGKAFREGVAPSRIVADEEQVQKIKRVMLAEMERWADAVIRTRLGIENLPNNTSPQGWKEPFPARAAVVSVLCGRIGSNLDAIVTPQSSKEALESAYGGK